jgi:hypothetical protein
MIVQVLGLHEHFPEAGDNASARAAGRDVLPVPRGHYPYIAS